MNKAQLVEQIIANLSESLAVLERAARASHAEATHESSKAENKYDTRGLEAAYLARGQSRQAKELLDSIKIYQGLQVKDFAEDDTIDLGAWVELQVDHSTSVFFMGPRNGGLEVDFHGQEVTLITPQSPLGQNLIGQRAGHRWTTKLDRATVKYQVVAVR